MWVKHFPFFFFFYNFFLYCHFFLSLVKCLMVLAKHWLLLVLFFSSSHLKRPAALSLSLSLSISLLVSVVTGWHLPQYPPPTPLPTFFLKPQGLELQAWFPWLPRSLLKSQPKAVDLWQTRAGKVEGQVLHARWWPWGPGVDVHILQHFGQAKTWDRATHWLSVTCSFTAGRTGAAEGTTVAATPLLVRRIRVSQSSSWTGGGGRGGEKDGQYSPQQQFLSGILNSLKKELFVENCSALIHFQTQSHDMTGTRMQYEISLVRSTEFP